MNSLYIVLDKQMKQTQERRVGRDERLRKSMAPSPCFLNSRAELRVTLMLFVTALTFLVLTTPISVGHVVNTLLEETVHMMMNQSAFITLFAIADLLAFAQHASQFYVCFVCSFCFRQALRRQFVRLATRIDRLLFDPMPVAPIPRFVELQRRSTSG